MPLLDTQGNDSADAYGGGAAAVINYIENVFSTYLYTGNASSTSITNGIDLSTNGGLVWIKSRTSADHHYLFDTNRGVYKTLYSDLTNGQDTYNQWLNAFNTNGFGLGTDGGTNGSGKNYASWTFRKQPKFFDIVTYTGDGVANRAISHNLGSTPGCIMIKCTSTTGYWFVYHQSNGTGKYMFLNTTDSVFTNSAAFPSVTSTTFTPVGSPVGSIDVNTNGQTFVAYLFAHNAGGFGLTGADNVISCGAFTSDGSGNASVTLGYEPQWIMVKRTSGADNWQIFDNMRGMSLTNVKVLYPNSSSVEDAYTGNYVFPTATGVSFQNGYLATSSDFIYIAIRRGPMAVPTDATTVYTPVAYSASSDNKSVTTNIPVDLILNAGRDVGSGPTAIDRLRGDTTTSYYPINTYATSAENSVSGHGWGLDSNTKVIDNINYYNQGSVAYNFIGWFMRRAPSFFDIVCYTGTGSATTVTHNLGVAPELIIIKKRSNTSDWAVLQTGLQKQLYLNGNYAGDAVNVTYFGNDSVYVAPTSTVFSLGSSSGVNGVSGQTFVAYLFATCAGVSKVGSYTGNGSTQAIACGFTGGARFVLIKRTDSTGDWYIYDTARGMTTLTDPYLLADSRAVEVATLGSVTTTTGGFTVNSAILAAINTSSATYIFLAIA
jgi:hypothetical protein